MGAGDPADCIIRTSLGTRRTALVASMRPAQQGDWVLVAGHPAASNSHIHQIGPKNKPPFPLIPRVGHKTGTKSAYQLKKGGYAELFPYNQ